MRRSLFVGREGDDTSACEFQTDTPINDCVVALPRRTSLLLDRHNGEVLSLRKLIPDHDKDKPLVRW